MKNISHTEAYTPYDHFFLKALRSVSRVVSVKKLTQPFWNRWRGGDISDEVLFDFLGSIKNLDDWSRAAEHLIAREEAELAQDREQLDTDHLIRRLRRMSYMSNLAHWGIMPLDDAKLYSYTKSRDYYIEAETLAFADRYRRFHIPWNGQKFPANLHLPVGNGPFPLVMIIHGLDDCKEEHLATELAMMDAGFAVVCFDGPGQAEAFLLDKIYWSDRFPEMVGAVLKALTDQPIDITRVGIMGTSIGALWGFSAASGDDRIKAIYDLGSPINTKSFSRVPFIIKSKICQITGAKTDAEIKHVLSKNYIDRTEILSGISAAIRIVMGAKDRVVPLRDKYWLRDELIRLGASRNVSMRVFEDGDHCCTNHIPELRQDMAEFFSKYLTP